MLARCGIPMQRAEIMTLETALRRMRLGQTLTVRRTLDVVPHLGTGIFHRNEQFGLLGNVPQVRDQIGADMAGTQVFLLLLIAPCVDDVGQYLLELRARHYNLSPFPTSS